MSCSNSSYLYLPCTRPYSALIDTAGCETKKGVRPVKRPAPTIHKILLMETGQTRSNSEKVVAVVIEVAVVVVVEAEVVVEAAAAAATTVTVAVVLALMSANKQFLSTEELIAH